MKVWDIRSYKVLHEYFTPTPASTIDISALGLISVAFGPNVSIWKDALREKAKSPYMTHLQPSCVVNQVRFVPFDDVLGVGHSGGMSSVVVPGSGEPNYDALEANPYQTGKQRKTAEVHALLEKLQPEMIAINPNFIGTVDRAPTEVIAAEKRLEFEANNPESSFKPRNRARGKSSSMRRYIRKQANIIDPRRAEVIERLEKEKESRAVERKRAKGDYVEEVVEYSALDRFTKKRKGQSG
ncbi:Small subunit (SSU) processome component [Irineochytrium annulatum]|nr:Small subunit (SSU) processome component [Irineochytrium annulatum]